MNGKGYGKKILYRVGEGRDTEKYHEKPHAE
jgi:hypothetical protein